jgi:hypothetical protein
MLNGGNGRDRGTARLKRYHHWEKRCRLVQRWFAADIIFEEDGNFVLTRVWRDVLVSGNRADRFHYNLASGRSLAAFETLSTVSAEMVAGIDLSTIDATCLGDNQAFGAAQLASAGVMPIT